MREFKVVRINSVTGEPYDDYLMFGDSDKADTWAVLQNEERPGSVLVMTDITSHSEEKHEY